MIATDSIQHALTGAATVLGLTAASVTAIVVIVKSPIFGRPIVYVWNKLVAEPVARWFKEVVGEAVDDRITHRLNKPNGGSSLYDISVSLSKVMDHLGLEGEDRRSEQREGDSYNALPKKHPLMPGTPDEQQRDAAKRRKSP